MATDAFARKKYSALKRSALKCFRVINKERESMSQPRILGRKMDVINTIILYKFYKTANFKMNLKKRQIKCTKMNQKDEKMDKMSMTIIEKSGFQFILIDGSYHKLTKKSYTSDEMDKWCNGRQNASAKMKQYQEKKKEERRESEEEKKRGMDNIYNREIDSYPPSLRMLIMKV